ncbi:MAG: VWA domain-containing protein [Chloroflexota bacterium]
MTFASPELLLALILVPLAILAYLYVQRRRSRYAVRFTNVDLLSNIVPRQPAWRRHLPPALYLGAIAALVFALARPSMVLPVPREEATIVLTMDVSRSMIATDVSPTRLAAAQEAARQFIGQLPDKFRVGLVIFSTNARIVVSPTTDRAALSDALDSLQADGGTALGDAIVASLQAAGLTATTDPGASATPASPSPSASANPSASPAPSGSAAPSPSATPTEPPLVATVLLSDGANSTGRTQPLDAAQQAADLHVPVYTIALGTPDGTVQVPNQFGQLEELAVPPDTDTLATIAEITGGRFFQAPSASDLADIYRSLGSRVGFTNEEREVTQLFAAAALGLVLVGGGLAAHWFNRFP